MRDSAPSPSQTLLFALGLEAGTAPPCRLPAFLPSFVETGTRGWGEGGVDVVQKARETTGRGSAGPRRRAETHAGCLAAVPSQRGLTRGSGGAAFPFSPCASAHGDDASNAPSRSRVAVTCARDVAVQIHGRLAVLGFAGFRRFTGERRALPATPPGPPGLARLTRAGVTGRRREGRDHGTHVPRASRARPSDWRLRLSAR